MSVGTGESGVDQASAPVLEDKPPKAFRRPQGTWSLSFLIHKMGAVTPAPWGWGRRERGQDEAVWEWWGGPRTPQAPPSPGTLLCDNFYPCQPKARVG